MVARTEGAPVVSQCQEPSSPLGLQNGNQVTCRSRNGVCESSSKLLTEDFVSVGESTCLDSVAGAWGDVSNIQGSLDLLPSITSGSVFVCVCIFTPPFLVGIGRGLGRH